LRLSDVAFCELLRVPENRKIREARWWYPMVFNWFNRFKKQEKKPEPEPKLPEAPVEVSPPQEEAEPYYMRLAKEIQRKEEQKLEELPAAEVLMPEPTPLTPEAPIFEPQKLEEPQKVELNEDIFDWQKILYGSTPAAAPILEKPPESVVEAAVPILEKLPEPVVEAPIPVLEKPPETFPLPAPVQEPIAEPILQLPTPVQEPSIAIPFTPIVAEPEVELPVIAPAEAAVPIETVIEQPSIVEATVPTETFIEQPSIVEVVVPIETVIKQPPVFVVAESPLPVVEKSLETIAPEVAPIQMPTVLDPPVLEPIAEVSVPNPIETSLPTAEPAPQPAQPAIPFWKRVLGQRAFYPQAPTSPPPTPEIQTPPPPVEVPPPVPPVAPANEALPVPPVLPPPASTPEPGPPTESEAVPFWQRILGQRPTTTPAAVVPETLLVPPEKTTSETLSVPREKPTAQTQAPQFDVGFLWSAEVLAAQGRRPEDVTLEEISWLQKLRLGLSRTRRGLVNNIKAIVGRGPLGPQEIEELEELLLQADVGIGVSEKILESLQVRVRQEALPPDQAMTFLKNQLRQQVELQGDDPAKFAPLRDQLNIWLVVGVNGVGKTTTIGKLASLASRSGYRTMIAAGDTFRAGAVSQVQIWANRSNVPVISNPSPNADPASVVFDAIGAARARNIELLIVDTAGRLQNKKNLMDELAKIRRIIDKQGVGAHVESLLVLDSTTGQNGLQQAKVFTEVASLTGVVLTKLDGSSKGGIALAIVDELKLPIRFVGVGEKVDDLRPFNSYEFIEALLSDVEE
jgi:fused signal recognition particle receptor